MQWKVWQTWKEPTFVALVAMAGLCGTSAMARAGSGSELSLDSTVLQYDGPNGQTSATTYGLGAAYHYTLERWPLRIGGGVRTGFGGRDVTVPAEIYGQLQFSATLGAFEPACGPELGISGFAKLPLRTAFPEGSRALSQHRVSAFYAAMTLAPLRWRFGSWSASFLEAQLGVSLNPLGSTNRLQLGLVRVGVEL